jgi:hypothetical protein
VTPRKTLNQVIAARLRHNREDGAAMMLALVIFMLTTVVSIIVATFSFTAIVSSRNLGIFTDENAAVQTAISNAVLQANASDSTSNGDANLRAHQYLVNDNSALPDNTPSLCKGAYAVNGTVADASSSYPMKWTWYSVRSENFGGSPVWYVYAFGYSANQSCDSNTTRRVRITLAPIIATSACYSDNNGTCISGTAGKTGTVIYLYAPTGVFAYGLLGNTSVTLGSSSSAYPHVYSYSSSNGTSPVAADDIGDSSASSNGSLQLYSHSTNLGIFQAQRGATCVAPAGGDTDACSSVTTRQNGFQASLANLMTATKLSSCKQPSDSPTAWKSSSGTPLQNGACYSSITFDKDYAQAALVKAYTFGPVTVNAGVKVNNNGIPSNLQIFSSGANCTFNTAASGQSTVFAGLVAGPNLSCADTAGAGGLNLYGALAGQRVNLTNSGTTFWEDDDVKSLSQTCANVSPCRNVWQAVDTRSYN